MDFFSVDWPWAGLRRPCGISVRMTMNYAPTHKVFITYHHKLDQGFRNHLVSMGERYRIFIDRSVDTGDISDQLSDEVIRENIRDEYLRDSTVTIVLVGLETKGRKHVDWEIYSSMIDGTINKRSGILVVNLPSTETEYSILTAHAGEKGSVYPDIVSWSGIGSRTEYEKNNPYMPARIVDNIMKPSAKVSVTNWTRIAHNPNALRFLIDAAFADRNSCEYDFSRPMKRANS